jgi:hypothetical protein
VVELVDELRFDGVLEDQVAAQVEQEVVKGSRFSWLHVISSFRHGRDAHEPG